MILEPFEEPLPYYLRPLEPLRALTDRLVDRTWKGKPILSVDFDGVLHSYTSGWKGPRCIPDPPVPGAMEWLRMLIPCPEHQSAMHEDSGPFLVCIFSSRSRYWGGRKAMREWLIDHLDYGRVGYMRFPRTKPPSVLSIDDRAFQFCGEFPLIPKLLEFKPYYKAGG